MSSEWFYLKGKDKCGPFTTAEMKRLAALGQLSKDDVVFKTGVAGSIRAGRVRGLFPAEASEPPQPPKAAEPEAKDAAGEVKTAAVALLGALTRRAKEATHKALESASQYTNKAQAELQEFHKKEPKERLAQIATNAEALTRQIVATSADKIERVSASPTATKRLLLLVGAGAVIAILLLGAVGSMLMPDPAKAIIGTWQRSHEGRIVQELTFFEDGTFLDVSLNPAAKTPRQEGKYEILRTDTISTKPYSRGQVPSMHDLKTFDRDTIVYRYSNYSRNSIRVDFQLRGRNTLETRWDPDSSSRVDSSGYRKVLTWSELGNKRYDCICFVYHRKKE